jgi:hypothetical protein
MLGKNGPALEQYTLRADDTNPPEIFRRFLKALQEHFPQRAILLLIDEYEILEAKISEGCLSRNVLTFFAGLLETEQVSFVFTGSKKLELRDQMLWGGDLLQKAVSRKISFLTKDDTARLITQPLAGKITFAPEVIAQIYALTAGQPFYTQLICQNLVYHLNEVKQYGVGSADLHAVVENIIENPPPQMIFNWGELSAERKLVLSLLAELSDAPGVFLSSGDISRGIKRNKLELIVSPAQLNSVLAELFQDEYVLQKDHKYGFRLDLFRRWIRHDHNIWQVKKEIGAEELARITKPAEQKATKRKRAVIILERVLLFVAIIAVGFLLQLLWNEWQKRDVTVQANGGPFKVVVVDAVDHRMIKTDVSRKGPNNKHIFKTKLVKGEGYIFKATLPADDETQSKTVTFASDTTINFNFKVYPVTVIADAASMMATLGDTTGRTDNQNAPPGVRFFVTAGEYMLSARDLSTDEEIPPRKIVVPDRLGAENIHIDFERVVVVTLRANFPFYYNWRHRKEFNKNKPTASRSVDSTSVVLRGCLKGIYQFTFENPRTGEKITLNKDVATDTTIRVEFNRNFRKPDGVTGGGGEPPVTTITKFRLEIYSKPPEAQVFLNDSLWGLTTFDKEVDSGRYEIELKKEGYEPARRQIQLTGALKIDINLEPQFGFLKIMVKDAQGKIPTDVTVYGKKDDWNNEENWGKARALARNPKSLMVGRYKIRVVSDEYPEEQRDIYISKNVATESEITLKEKK